MNKGFLFILLLFLVPIGQAAEPSVTYYNGYVTLDGVNKNTNALVTIVDSAGNTLDSKTSLADGSYLVTVPWDESSTSQDEGVVSGETIYLKVNGTTYTSRTIDAMGSNSRLDLAPGSTSAGSSGGSSGGSSNGGSGGGGSASPETFENIVNKESRDEILAKDVPKTYSFTTKELPVSAIIITSNISTGNINVLVELLKTRSNIAKNDPPGNVYKYLNIWVGTSGYSIPKNIKEAVIKFKIENSWIASQGIKETDIVMHRWDGTQWVPLVTEKKTGDNTYAFYEAKTNAFSPFAITSVNAAPAASTEATAIASPTEKQETPAPIPTKKAPGFGLVLTIAGLMAFVLRKRSK